MPSFPRPDAAARWKAALAHDYFPDLDRALRQRLWNPLGGLTLAAAVALMGGLYLHPQGLVVFAGLAAVLTLGVVWPWLNVRLARAEWSFDRDRGTEGDAVTARLTVRNRGPWVLWGLTGNSCDRSLAAAVPAVARFGRATVAVEFVPPKRGVYPGAGATIESGFPFGLWTAKRPCAVVEPLVVWPKTFSVGALPESAGSESVEGVVARHKPGHGGDVMGVRPYRRGDSPRRIHWPRSARHDRLIVCELQSNARPLVEIVLDADAATLTGDAREWAIRVAASLYEAWVRHGAEVGLVAGDTTLSPAAGTGHRRRVFDALARLPDDGPPLARVLRRPCGAAVQVVVTGTADVPGEVGRYRVVIGSRTKSRDVWLSIPDPADTPAALQRGGRP